jgi:hypothetical protein
MRAYGAGADRDEVWECLRISDGLFESLDHRFRTFLNGFDSAIAEERIARTNYVVVDVTGFEHVLQLVRAFGDPHDGETAELSRSKDSHLLETVFERNEETEIVVSYHLEFSFTTAGTKGTGRNRSGSKPSAA